jgi:hypothetical protein
VFPLLDRPRERIPSQEHGTGIAMEQVSPFARVYEEDHMETEFPFQTSVCPEYECLLLLSKTALDGFARKREELSQYGQNNHEAMKCLLHLRAAYQDSYSKLLHHFDSCQVCQYISKLGERPRHPDVSECESITG